MSVRIEKDGAVWTVVHDRPEARNAMDPKSADELTAAFLAFDADKSASVAVFYGEGGAFCSGWDLKYASTLTGPDPLGELDIPLAGPRINGGEIPRGPLGPSRLELDKPVIAAIEGPAVAGGMELGLWCDFRVMAAEAYFGVYCRRWGVPLIDGGTVRLPRIVGQGRALEIILTGRQVPAEECLRIGLCEYVTPKGGARAKAEELAHDIARFPQICVRTDRRSALKSHGLSVLDGLIQEWYNGREALTENGVAGAARFKDGLGRHGDFSKIGWTADHIALLQSGALVLTSSLAAVEWWSMDGQTPKMTVAELEAFLRVEFPQMYRGTPTVIEHVDGKACRVREVYDEGMLRPGGTISGPTLMALADFAMYVVLLSAIGPVGLAVTTSLNINFLSKAPAGHDVIADARLMKLGKRLAVGEITLTSAASAEPVAHGTATYSIPPKRD